MRPRKYYIVFEYGKAIGIAEGIDAARKLHAGLNGHRTRLDAEECAAWWNYQRGSPINTFSAKE